MVLADSGGVHGSEYGGSPDGQRASSGRFEPDAGRWPTTGPNRQFPAALELGSYGWPGQCGYGSAAVSSAYQFGSARSAPRNTPKKLFAADVPDPARGRHQCEPAVQQSSRGCLWEAVRQLRSAAVLAPL